MTIANVNVRQILLKKGNTARSQNYTGAIGEITLDTDLNSIRVHNGVTAGGVNILATQAQIDALTSSISTITGLDANLVANISSLLANAASQQTTINSLLANAASQQTQIANITTGTATFGNLLPSANVTYSLGSPTQQWKDLYVSSNTIYIAGIPLRVDTNGNLTINGNSVGGGTGSNDKQLPSDANGVLTNLNGELAWGDPNRLSYNDNLIYMSGYDSNLIFQRGQTRYGEIKAGPEFFGLENSGEITINTGATWSFAQDGTLTFPDSLTVADSVISRRLEEVNGEAVDAVGSKLTFTNTDVQMEAYADPDGPNNIAHARLFANASSAIMEASVEDVAGVTFGRITVAGGGIDMSLSDGVLNNSWDFALDGTTLLPNGGRVVFGEQNGDSYIQAGQGFHISSREGISLEAVDATDPENPVTQGWYFSPDSRITFPDGTKQSTAYVHHNVNLDGGGAGTVYEVEVAFADGGFASIRSFSETFDGNDSNNYILDGGKA
jgi:hypothetical protein